MSVQSLLSLLIAYAQETRSAPELTVRIRVAPNVEDQGHVEDQGQTNTDSPGVGVLNSVAPGFDQVLLLSREPSKCELNTYSKNSRCNPDLSLIFDSALGEEEEIFSFLSIAFLKGTFRYEGEPADLLLFSNFVTSALNREREISVLDRVR